MTEATNGNLAHSSNAHSSGEPPQQHAPHPPQPPRTYLSDLGPGQRVDDLFIIQHVQLKTNKRGDPYLTMKVADRTRNVTGNWWDRGEAMYRRLPNPGVVRVKAVFEEFNGNPQLKIENILQLRDPSKIDYGELLPKTDKSIVAMFAELSAMLRSFESRTLSALAEAYLNDDELMDRLRRAPAAMTFHHAYLGGLLEHTLNAMRAADTLARLYPGLNRELCVFGVFIHDLAKTWELTYETAFDYSDGGRLVGHIVKSALWLEDKVRDAEAAGVAVPRDVVDVLQHIILSHHGELALGFGSAVSPATPESLFVHHVENLDAKMTMAMGATRWGEAAEDPSRWTPFMKAFDGRLYKPDVVARADAGTADEKIARDVEADASAERGGGSSASMSPLFDN